jgi:small conductance mechanosensitive channel
MVFPRPVSVAVRFVGFAVLLLVALASTAVAQTAKPAPPPAGEAEVRALISTLENDAERQRLIAQLQALLRAQNEIRHGRDEATDDAADVIDAVSARLGVLSEHLISGVEALLNVRGLGGWLRQQVESPARRTAWLRIAVAVAATFAAGIAAEWIVRRLLARPRRRLESRDGEGDAGSESAGAPASALVQSARWARIPLLLAYTILDAIAVASFGGAAYLVMAFVAPDALTRNVTLAFVTANVVQRAVYLAGRAVLAPQARGLRLLAISDTDAAYLYVWVQRFANIVVYGGFLVHAAAVLRTPAGAVATLRLLLGLIVALLAIVLILQNRTTVAGALAGKTQPDGTRRAGIRRRFADVWHVAAIAYVVAVFLAWGLDIKGGFKIIWRATALTGVIVVAAFVVNRALERLLRCAFDIGDEAKQRLPGFEARANRYLAIVHAVLRAIVIVVAACAVLETWGIDSFGWIGSPVGRRVMSAIATIGLLAVIAVIVWELSSTAIERRLQAAEREPGGSARARTLLPLLRHILLMTLAAIVGLVALSQLGIDIGPLLAGAGIIGLAVGFGAQTLVKDIITGMFILLENQIAVGDSVRVGTHAGLVEGITIRTLRIRDGAGTVHIVPFSEVTAVENMNRGFARYMIDVALSYDEDVDRVASVLRDIGMEMQKDPKYRDDILQPLDYLGVERFEANAVIVRAQITTRPNRQGDVGREFNRRMKLRFDELGVQNFSPQRTLAVTARDSRPHTGDPKIA